MVINLLIIYVKENVNAEIARITLSDLLFALNAFVGYKLMVTEKV